MSTVLQGNVGRSRLRLSVLSDGQWFITVEPEVFSDKPISLTRASSVKSSKGSLSGVKSISYGESLLEVRKAKQLGFDDGIFLNENGHVVETAFSNLLILTSDGWLTPDLKPDVYLESQEGYYLIGLMLKRHFLLLSNFLSPGPFI